MKKKRLSARLYHGLVPDSLKPLIFHVAKKARTDFSRFRDGKDRPLEVNIETIANQCTRLCDYCPIDPKDRLTLDTATIRAVVDDLAEWGFTGTFSPHGYNEPLQDERIFEIFEHAIEKLPDGYVVLYTNGDLLTPKIVQDLDKMGLARIYITMHEPMLEHKVKSLQEMDAQFGVITLVDYRDGHRTIPLINRGGLVDVGPIVRPPCYDVNALAIRATGDVIICPSDFNSTSVFGNVKNNSIREIWEQEDYVELRKLIRRGKFGKPDVPDICRACGYEAKWTYGSSELQKSPTPIEIQIGR